MLNTFFRKLLTTKGGSSKEIAKKRLQFALIYDQMEISEETLDLLQKDIVKVLRQYFVIEEESLKLEICREGRASALVVNTPILKAMRERVTAS
jgi:cell division topological specificity factor